jgi:hypothetical protein
MGIKKSWKELKPIIASTDWDGSQYHSVLDEEGNILLTNAKCERS